MKLLVTDNNNEIPKTIEMGSQIRQQGQLLSALLEAFSCLRCIRILTSAANLCKTYVKR